jgi:hypothetical protein
MKLFRFLPLFKIDRASAGNVKRSKEEVAADPEKENQFGYTTSKHKFITLCPYFTTKEKAEKIANL